MNRVTTGFLVALSVCLVAVLLWFTSQSIWPRANVSDVVTIRADIIHNLRAEDAETAYRTFKMRYASAEFDVGHNAAHIFGESLYDVFGISGVRTCDAEFNYGCYHGFFTRAVSAEGLDIVTALDGACMESDSPTACQHGIGHGILEYLGHTRLNEALLACKKTYQPDPLAGCTSGVFMEYNVPLSVGVDGTFALQTRNLEDPGEPYHPCPELPSEFRLSCYHELPQWWMQVYHADFEAMGRYCAAPYKNASDACFAGLANVIASYAEYDSDKTLELCTRMPDARTVRECIVNAAWAFNTDAKSHESARALCSHLPESERKQCPQ